MRRVHFAERSNQFIRDYYARPMVGLSIGGAYQRFRTARHSFEMIARWWAEFRECVDSLRFAEGRK